jgi:DNA invertase Pin-like site-specific DNA recombinase
MKFVAYYRVSTKKQGDSGLGLEAQRATVLSYIKYNGNQLVGEFTEVESGKNDRRQQLAAAIAAAKEEDAMLCIAKLDRLSRNVTFISRLMDSKVRFVCCDMPDATDLTIHIFAAIAEWERERISTRTKEGIQAKRVREPNWQPGTANLTQADKDKAHKIIRYKARMDKKVRWAYHFIKPCREAGDTYQTIANKLNAEGYRTRTGKMFHAMQVFNIWKRFEKNPM